MVLASCPPKGEPLKINKSYFQSGISFSFLVKLKFSGIIDFYEQIVYISLSIITHRKQIMIIYI